MKTIKFIARVLLFPVLIVARLTFIGKLMIISEENKYQYIELPYEYVGSATGTERYFVVWTGEKYLSERKYVYNNYDGYTSIPGPEYWEYMQGKYGFWDINLEFDEDYIYICTYGYKLKKLEYTPEECVHHSGEGYYNRAQLLKENYCEDTYYFYKIENVKLGDMNREYEWQEYEKYNNKSYKYRDIAKRYLLFRYLLFFL